MLHFNTFFHLVFSVFPIVLVYFQEYVTVFDVDREYVKSAQGDYDGFRVFLFMQSCF
jgi:hypothetical protein